MEKSKSKKNESKTINQTNMENLEVMFGEFIPVDQIWKLFKQNSFEMQKTIDELSKIHSPKTLPEKKTVIEDKSHLKTENEEEKKKPFKTSEEVYNRLKWSGKYKTEEFTIGYEDRFVGIIESPLDTFSFRDVSHDNFIPWHRVQYYKQNDKLVWDRQSRLDEIFFPPSENATDNSSNVNV